MGMWEVEVRHDGLNKYRVIRGRDKREVDEKARVQLAVWEEAWQKKLAAEHKARERERKAQDKEAKLQLANERTREAIETLDRVENTLRYAITEGRLFDWEILKEHSSFSEKKPDPPQPKTISEAPVGTDRKYRPQLGALDKMLKSRKQSKITEAEESFKRDYDAWEKQKEEILAENAKLDKRYQEKLKQWEASQREFLEKQQQHNDQIDKRKEEYMGAEPDAIAEYCEYVLQTSDYPESFPKQFELDCNPDTKTMIVEYSLPSIDDVPKLKGVKYVQTRDEFTESLLSATALNKLYDSLIYQIALRTLYELYESDIVNAIDSIVFNGWVKSVDTATGQEINPCIVSIQAGRGEFTSLNLANVDPKVCFKNLKGIGSSKLYSLTPIAPILNIDREDSRFIDAYSVAGDLGESTNLAAMDWEDFEHLIRELFEKEFSEAGGEVKITQASRDRGVDAVAFDPDPIRGGKIVIQAKRYTNTVGVSAVRDLYGTVMNEGATKGILVTTSDYGPDAYEFAKGKPLTLLTGGNLLHLLEKHGHKATIDLKAARKILSEKESQ